MTEGLDRGAEMSGEEEQLRQLVASNIKRGRERKSLTQKELARLIDDVPSQLVSRWERAETLPSPRNLTLLSSALGVRVGWFYDPPRERGKS